MRVLLTLKVSTATRKYSEETILFPTITVCPEFPIGSDYAANLFSEKSQGVESMPEAILQLEHHTYNRTGHYMEKKLKMMLSELSVISCTIGNRTCSASDFQWIWMPWYYNCYRFNAGFNSNNTPIELIRVDATDSLFKFTL